MAELRLRIESECSDEILAPGEPHLAFVLLLDTSSSMNRMGK